MQKSVGRVWIRREDNPGYWESVEQINLGSINKPNKDILEIAMTRIPKIVNSLDTK